jgi:hypothetical protein
VLVEVKQALGRVLYVVQRGEVAHGAALLDEAPPTQLLKQLHITNNVLTQFRWQLLSRL